MVGATFISIHFLLSVYFVTTKTYKCMRLINPVYGIEYDVSVMFLT